MHRFVWFVFVLSSWIPAASHAQETAVLRAEGDELVLDANEGQRAPSLHALMREVAAISAIDFYLPERADEDALRKEEVRLQQPKRFPRAKAYDFFQCLLKQHNFAVVEVGEPPVRTVRLVRMQGEGLQALKSSVRYVPAAELSLYRDRPASLITTTIEFAHLDAGLATKMLSRFFSNAALEGFASLDRPNTRSAMMIVGFGPTLCSIRDMLATLDLPPRGDAAAEELRVGVELWEVTDPALRRAAEELEDPAEIAKRLRANQGARALATYTLSLLTGKPATVEEPLAATEGGSAPAMARIEVQAQRHDDERYQLDFAVKLGPKPSEGQEASSVMQVPSTMLVRPGELRLCSTSRGERAYFALIRLNR